MYISKSELVLYSKKDTSSLVEWPIVVAGQLLAPTGNPDDDDDWKHVDLSISPGVILATGWALNEKLQETDHTNPFAEIDQQTFVRHCVQIEMSTSKDVLKDFPIVADYLIGLAILESNMANKSTGNGVNQRVGPYQFSTEDWARFRDLGLQGSPTSPHRIENAFHQVQAAADFTHNNLKKLDAAHKAAVATDAGDKYVADFLNVFQAHLIGPEAAYACVTSFESNSGDISMRDVLLKHYSTDASLVDALIERRKKYLKVFDEVARVHQFFAVTEKALDRVLKRAANLIAKHMPEVVPNNQSGGAPWFKIASDLESRGINESNSAQEIIGMFKATDSGITTLEHWCGAFVAHCLVSASDVVADPAIKQSIVSGSARAANWANWGDIPLSSKHKTIPQGAVVVLSPSDGTGTSGHVGFFHSRNGDFVFLLGGNQSNSVKVSRYRASRIRAIRWQHFSSLNPDLEAGAITINTEQIPSGREDIVKMIVESFAAAGFGNLQQIAALANAIRESKLNPNAHNTSGEDSVGLFQCNRDGGLGTGKTVGWLKNPQNNIDLIISEAKKYADFKNANTIEDAVREFVYKVERPRDKPGETKIRIGIAKKLLG